MESKELYHHGVLGMKWGKRKDRSKTSGSSKKSSKKSLRDKSIEDAKQESSKKPAVKRAVKTALGVLGGALVIGGTIKMAKGVFELTDWVNKTADSITDVFHEMGNH